MGVNRRRFKSRVQTVYSKASKSIFILSAYMWQIIDRTLFCIAAQCRLFTDRSFQIYSRIESNVLNRSAVSIILLTIERFV